MKCQRPAGSGEGEGGRRREGRSPQEGLRTCARKQALDWKCHTTHTPHTRARMSTPQLCRPLTCCEGLRPRRAVSASAPAAAAPPAPPAAPAAPAAASSSPAAPAARLSCLLPLCGCTNNSYSRIICAEVQSCWVPFVVAPGYDAISPEQCKPQLAFLHPPDLLGPCSVSARSLLGLCSVCSALNQPHPNPQTPVLRSFSWLWFSLGWYLQLCRPPQSSLSPLAPRRCRPATPH